MKRPHSLVKVAGVVLGSTGTVLCLALIVLAWIAGHRLGRGTDRLFSSAEDALVAVRERVVRTQDRVAGAKRSAEDIERSLLEWTRQEVSQRQVSQLDLAAKTERLVSALQHAENWLEVAESSVGLVHEALANGTLANGTLASPPARTAALDGLIEEIASLRAQLGEVSEVAVSIQERVAGTGGEPLETRTEQAISLVRRVVSTLGSADSRFGKVEDRLTTAHSQAQDLSATVQWWILVAAIGIALLLLWMAAGHAALCWLAWTRLGRR